jgi:hypothetical protein
VFHKPILAQTCRGDRFCRCRICKPPLPSPLANERAWEPNWLTIIAVCVNLVLWAMIAQGVAVIAVQKWF